MGAIAGVEMFNNLLEMLKDKYDDVQINEIEAYGLSCEVRFFQSGEEYSLKFENVTRADDDV